MPRISLSFFPLNSPNSAAKAASATRKRLHNLNVARAPASLPLGWTASCLLALTTIPWVENESQAGQDPDTDLDPFEPSVSLSPSSAPWRLLAVAREGRWETGSATRRDARRELRTLGIVPRRIFSTGPSGRPESAQTTPAARGSVNCAQRRQRAPGPRRSVVLPACTILCW
jgi:hypothetical protein